MVSEKNNRLDDALAKAIGSAKRGPDFEKWRREHPDAVQILTDGRKKISSSISITKIILHSRITKLTAAAAVIAVLFFSLHRYGRSIDGSGAAWADVIEQICKAHSVTYKETFECDDINLVPPLVTQCAMNDRGVTRKTYSWGNVMIDDWSRGIQLQIEPKEKKARLTRYVGRPANFAIFNRFDWLSSGQTEHCKFAGQVKINGKVTNLFIDEDKTNFQTVTIWVDPETDLPIQVKCVLIPNPDPNTNVPNISLSNADFGGDGRRGGAVGGSRSKSTTLMSDFVWNAELEESLFSTTPPEGFSIEESQIKASEPAENDLVDSLAFWSEMSDGSFPTTINDLADANKIREMLIMKFDENGDPDKEMRRAFEKANIMINGLVFARRQRDKGNWYYAGDNVKLGDSDKPVCWWKKEGSDQFRVIYGDFTIGDANKDQLPKLP
jgi:hypothetical protein